MTDKFSSDFIIENYNISELSAQKKKSTITQIPFSISHGPSMRSRGRPYYASRNTQIGGEQHSVIDYDAAGGSEYPCRDPLLCGAIIYFDFQDGTGATVKNHGLTGAAGDGTLSTYGGGADEWQWSSTSGIKMSGTYSLELNHGAPPASTADSDGYLYIPPAFQEGMSPSFGGKMNTESGVASGDRWTVSMWWKCTRPEFFGLWYVGLPGSVENGSVGLYVLADNSFVMDGNNESHAENTLVGSAVSDIRDGNAHHCVVTYDGGEYEDPTDVGDRAKIYVDGVDITTTDTLNTSQYGVNNDSFVIGRAIHRNGGDNHLSGVIGEFAYWDRVLDADQVNKLYNGGALDTRTKNVLTVLDERVFHYD